MYFPSSPHFLASSGRGSAPLPFAFPVCPFFVLFLSPLRQPFSHEHQHLPHSSTLTSAFCPLPRFFSKVSLLRFGPFFLHTSYFFPFVNCSERKPETFSILMREKSIFWHPEAGLTLRLSHGNLQLDINNLTEHQLQSRLLWNYDKARQNKTTS